MEDKFVVTKRTLDAFVASAGIVFTGKSRVEEHLAACDYFRRGGVLGSADSVHIVKPYDANQYIVAHRDGQVISGDQPITAFMMDNNLNGTIAFGVPVRATYGAMVTAFQAKG